MADIKRIVTSDVPGRNLSDTYERSYVVGEDGRIDYYTGGGEMLAVVKPGTIYGADHDSADGQGLNTLKLIPHAPGGFPYDDRYVIIDPTMPNHIHIRAGGAIDQSNAELILGGEANHVKVDDGSRVVTISSKQPQSVQAVLNINFESNEYMVFNDMVPVSNNGWYTEVNGTKYYVADVTYPTEGQTQIYVPGATFQPQGVYNMFSPEVSSQWQFDGEGIVYGPGDGAATTFTKIETINSDGTGQNVKIGDDAWIGDLNVANHIAITGLQDSGEAGIIFGAAATERISSANGDLSIISGNGMTIEAVGGDMNFYMDGAAYIGPSDSENRIAQMKDIANYVDSYLDASTGTTVEYIDQQDAATLAAANAYADSLVLAAEGFNYLGEWDSETQYSINDVVVVDGSSYICIFPNTAVNPATASFGFWEVFAAAGEGFRWTGTWSSMGYNGSSYVAGDVVEYQGSTYLCTPQMGMASPNPPIYQFPSPNAGQPNPDWSLMASAGDQGEGFNWKGTWSSMPMTPYVEGDVVFHNGSSYLATPDFMGASAGSGTPGGLYNGWKPMALGLTWRGAWISNPNPIYKLADVVSRNGNSYISVSDMPGGTPGEQSGSSSWALMAAAGEAGEGFTWRGGWNGFIDPAYSNNDLVIYNGSTYLVTDSTLLSSSTPPDNNDGQGATQGWALFTAKGDKGLNWLGAYNSQISYAKDSVVSYQGSSYVSKSDFPGIYDPTNTDHWDLVAAKGADGDPASIDTGTTTINSYSPVWSGTGLDINPTAPVPPATGSYIKIGNLVQVQIEVNFTEVLDFGSGQYSITLPLPSLYHTDVYGGSVHDTGTTTDHYSLKGHLSANSSNMTLWYISGSSKDEPFKFNAPINLSTDDKFHMAFSYICA